LTQLAGGQADAKGIFETLAVADIQAAADVLRPVYDAAGGHDGFVSLEVAPTLAHDTEGTIAEARRLHAAVNRPNLMIKVPATRAGLPAIRRLIADGICVNVTLIFSLDRYAAVKEAYMQGIDERVALGKPVDKVASVASFFVSRVDVAVDALLDKLAQQNPARAAQLRSLQGKAAVANSKLAYRQFEEAFGTPRWQNLAAAGARVQRPLWASTSTKNPAYPDLIYVDTLIGPHTVNTMPPQTLQAFADHGTPQRTVDQGLEQARADLQALAAAGISLDQVTEELEADGVKKFADSFEQLLGTIEERRKQLMAA
jgi:transaldolase